MFAMAFSPTFKREEDVTMKVGKLDEETRRDMSELG